MCVELLCEDEVLAVQWLEQGEGGVRDLSELGEASRAIRLTVAELVKRRLVLITDEELRARPETREKAQEQALGEKTNAPEPFPYPKRAFFDAMARDREAAGLAPSEVLDMADCAGLHNLPDTATPPVPLRSVPPDEPSVWPQPLRAILAKANLEKLQALAEVWGVDEAAALNVAVHEAWAATVADARDAEGG